MLSDLRYPVLTANPYGIGMIKTYRHWDYLVAEGFLEGVADHEIIFNSNGGEYRFQSIQLQNPSPTRSFLQLAGNFFLPPKRTDYTMASITAELTLVQRHTSEGLKARVRSILEQNPSWRSGVPRPKLERELQEIIDRAESIEELISTFLYLDMAKPSLRPTGSKITKDSRTKKRPF